MILRLTICAYFLLLTALVAVNTYFTIDYITFKDVISQAYLELSIFVQQLQL